MSQNIVSRMVDRGFRAGVALAVKMMGELPVSAQDVAVQVHFIAQESGVSGSEKRWAGYVQGCLRKQANWAEYNAGISDAQQHIAAAVAERICQTVDEMMEREAVEAAWRAEQAGLYTP